MKNRMKKWLGCGILLVTGLLMAGCGTTAETQLPDDGVYQIELTLEGGTGRASVESPTELTVSDGTMIAKITWSSPYYDYMKLDGTRYDPVNTDGNSVFEIPVSGLDEVISVTADTTAMSVPHEIDYTITFQSETIQEKP